MKMKFSNSTKGSLIALSLLVGCNDITEPDPAYQSSSSDISSSSSSAPIDLPNPPSRHVEGPIEKLLDPKPCLATFKDDYTVNSYFEKKLFEIKSGESFMVASGPELFDKTTLYKEHSDVDGKHQIIDFDIDGDLTKSLLQFSCYPDTAPMVYVNFKELEFYKDSKLTQKVCTLPVGTVLSTKETGYVVVIDGDPEKPAYEMYPTNTQPGCTGGQYVPADEFEMYETHYVRAALGTYVVAP